MLGEGPTLLDHQMARMVVVGISRCRAVCPVTSVQLCFCFMLDHLAVLSALALVDGVTFTNWRPNVWLAGGVYWRSVEDLASLVADDGVSSVMLDMNGSVGYLKRLLQLYPNLGAKVHVSLRGARDDGIACSSLRA